jgi:hypothetical protein
MKTKLNMMITPPPPATDVLVWVRRLHDDGSAELLPFLAFRSAAGQWPMFHEDRPDFDLDEMMAWEMIDIPPEHELVAMRDANFKAGGKAKL